MRPPSLQQFKETVMAGPPYAEAFLQALAADPRAGAQALLKQAERRVERSASEAARQEARLQFERAAAQAGYTRIAGVDEAGRGPLAGPIVAAAVMLMGPPPAGLNDSKQLSEAQRERLFEALLDGPHATAVAIIPPGEIDVRGIQWANQTAMCRAADGLRPAPEYLLVDGFSLPDAPCPHERIIKGDARSLSIAAASILAKVTRDRLMLTLDAAHPGYGFAQHKGYGTREHLDAIEKLGPCAAHRRSFAPLSRVPEQATLI